MITLKPILRINSRDLENMMLLKLIKAQNQLCFYCHKHMSLDAISKDHFFPKSHGFSLQGNLVLAHSKCNNDKSNRYPTIEEIIRWTMLYKGKHKRKLRIATHNNKPRFKLVMTEELIHDYLS